MHGAERLSQIRFWRAAFAVAVAAIGWMGCGKTAADGGSGETHFLAFCDGPCDDGLECVCGVCTRVCTADTDCASLGSGEATCMTPSCGTENLCDVQCEADADCSALGASYRCRDGRCRAGTSGGGDGGTEVCTTPEGTPIHCDFAECPIPPISTCSLEDTCDNLGCGGLSYDENGCARPECQSDADCGATERCVLITCGNGNLSCAYSDGTCQCGGPDICLSQSLCNPESIAGPRGEFQSLEIVQGAGPCPPGESCIWSWTITPDGHVEYSKNGVVGSADLTETDLSTLLSAVNGVELRPALRDGITCDQPPTDVGVTFRLHLSTQTLERDVTGCAISGPEGNVFDLLFDLATQY